MNLNGVWKYSIRNPDELDPEEHDGHILVPFPIESSLSGVMKDLSPTQVLYYEKTGDYSRRMARKKYFT